MEYRDFGLLSETARSTIFDILKQPLLITNKEKRGFDPVTEADRSAELALRAAIEQRYPDDAIWGEEYGWTGEGASRVWSIDPIDGTRALICGLSSWSVLVGLIDDGRHVAGMIDLPALDELLIAVNGSTEQNGLPVQTSGCERLSEARFSTTDPYLFSGAEADGFDRVRRAARVSRYGLDAMAYARVATGDLDLVIENGLKRHDYDALIPVVRGAGGHIGDWSGGERFEGGRIVAAASRKLYDEAVALLAV